MNKRLHFSLCEIAMVAVIFIKMSIFHFHAKFPSELNEPNESGVQI